ncbi:MULTISPECIES: type II toxin-antitoxin system PemK/MazF family toxin [unclassified Lactobacillus]|uniref:type II toxin-antitoxin system PemK/MazF family toxin n=1 Tax=unclassified Lactobacillus TaxID=2620435 RepID=UPI000EFD8039|nr:MULTISPECIES: type II toxin-antitoxin system PemK/MazF family toxin [unclassified Lactobacillus]RMC38107.1 type II toxin-antitoxin system PemK/MazF family toxin [Lactobacillus sp. ESL0237]RMC42640.1 type II toxin-antitoxin system PemK/MazF family toxin [Lactobacillus sp. ESL0234]RMC43335.1 type II toxin-antitoxin system PemK/MazF family toxin [Lactobacillus sp. ESL0236]RMC47852.1 type II toxin-antitoxin system PemK/MazF family toxin [Lactobacillus sp. ESL0225]
MKLEQGDIIWLDLNPAKGTETQKKRPCLIVSNNNYNRIFNTVITVPISTAKKYLTEEKYVKSPMFIKIDKDNIHGTALLQQARAVDPRQRIGGKLETKLTSLEMKRICKILSQFY